MAIYSPIIKTLKKAVPTVRAADNVVTRWEVEVEYAYEGDGADLPAWSTSYSESTDIKDPTKTAADYTKAELIALVPSVIDDHVFHAHYEAFNLPAPEPETTTDNEFDLNNLPD